MGDLRDPLAVGTRAEELTGDRALLDAMVEVEVAMSRALVDVGIAPAWMSGVCDTLQRMEILGTADAASSARAGGNPAIPLVPALRRAAESLHAGAADHLHLGATSQDVVDSATMLVARRVLDEVVGRSLELAAALAELAVAHLDTPTVGRTLGQHASPTTFGFVAAGWLGQVTGSVTRLVALRDTLPAQWGGSVGDGAVLDRIAALRHPGAGEGEGEGDGAVLGGSGPTAAPVAIDTPPVGAPAADLAVRALADRLGLASPSLSWHSDRSVVAELGSALSLAVGAAGRFALDVVTLARTEIGEVRESQPEGGGGSSAMPHKSNPVTAVLVVAAARRAPGLLSTLHSSLLGEDQRATGSWHAEWPALAALQRLAITATAGASDLARRLEVDVERMRANLESSRGLVSSELVTAVLAESVGRQGALEAVERAISATPPDGTLRDSLTSELERLGLDDATRDRVTAAFDDAPAPHPESSASRSALAAVDRFRALAAVERDGRSDRIEASA